MQENEAFITIKEHKEGFPHCILCRLLNPSNTNIGKISKRLLDKINSAILSGTKINQWKNTSSIITWFEKITHRETSSFLFWCGKFLSIYLPQFIQRINWICKTLHPHFWWWFINHYAAQKNPSFWW